jgi:ribosome-binding protein aMBF1 (putative translation factor)
LARLTFTQRTIDVPLATKTEYLKPDKPIPVEIKTLGQLLIGRRTEAGLTQKELAGKAGIPRKWVGRWERGRAIPNHAEWSKLGSVLTLPAASSR